MMPWLLWSFADYFNHVDGAVRSTLCFSLPYSRECPIAHFSDFCSAECCAVQFDGKCYIFRTIKRYGTAECRFPGAVYL